MGVFLPLDALWTSHRLWGGRKCKFASFKSKRGACISLAHEIIFTRNFLSLRHPYNCSAMKQRVSKRRGFTCAENWKLLPLMKTFLLSFGFLWNLNCEMLRFGRWIFPCRWEEDATPSKWQISMLVQLWRKTSRKKKHGKKKSMLGEAQKLLNLPPNILVHWEELETSPGLCATADGKKHYFPPWSQGKSQTTADKSKGSEIWKYYKDGYGMLYWLRFYKSPLYFWRFHFYFILSPFLPSCLLYFLILTGTEHAKGRKGERAKSQ